MTNFAKTRGGRSAIQKLLNGGKLSARHLASMGKIQGTLCISRLIGSSEMQISCRLTGKVPLADSTLPVSVYRPSKEMPALSQISLLPLDSLSGWYTFPRIIQKNSKGNCYEQG